MNAYDACEMEMIMSNTATSGQIALEPGTLHRVEHGLGRRVTSVTGTVWVTQANDPRDIILPSGGSFAFDRPGLAVVYALAGPASFTVEAAETAEALAEAA